VNPNEEVRSSHGDHRGGDILGRPGDQRGSARGQGDHQAHTEDQGAGRFRSQGARHRQGKDCKECHHKDEKGKEQGCHQCHKSKTEGKVVELKEAYHATCKDCHKKDASKKAPTMCNGCHKK